MSTRGLVGFTKNGETIGMYNHFDSYPRGLGRNLHEFVSNNGPSSPHVAFSLISWVDEPDVDITGNAGAALLYEAIKSTTNQPSNPVGSISTSFLKNSLFCEWAYIFNLDTNELEVYEGFQKRPHNDAPTGFSAQHASDRYKEYYPVKKIVSFNLNDLSCMPFSDFIKEIESRSS